MYVNHGTLLLSISPFNSMQSTATIYALLPKLTLYGWNSVLSSYRLLEIVV